MKKTLCTILATAAVLLGVCGQNGITAALADANYGSASDSEVVYVTPKGKKYHKANCKTLKRSHKKMAVSKDEAKRMGRQPCKVCHPGL